MTETAESPVLGEGVLEVRDDRVVDPMIGVALADAATNCQRDQAMATLTLRSGAQLRGKLKKSNLGYQRSVHIEKQDGGWITVLSAEIVAVETTPPAYASRRW